MTSEAKVHIPPRHDNRPARDLSKAWRQFRVIEHEPRPGWAIIERCGDDGQPSWFFGAERLVVPLAKAAAIADALNGILA